jgi:hypothetical protein
MGAVIPSAALTWWSGAGNVLQNSAALAVLNPKEHGTFAGWK